MGRKIVLIDKLSFRGFWIIAIVLISIDLAYFYYHHQILKHIGDILTVCFVITLVLWITYIIVVIRYTFELKREQRELKAEKEILKRIGSRYNVSILDIKILERYLSKAYNTPIELKQESREAINYLLQYPFLPIKDICKEIPKHGAISEKGFTSRITVLRDLFQVESKISLVITLFLIINSDPSKHKD